MSCSTVATYGGSALTGVVPGVDLAETARHVVQCPACTTHVDQLATTSALLGAPRGTRPLLATSTRSADDDSSTGDMVKLQHQFLNELAQAADVAHAEDLVQQTWDYFLTQVPTRTPRREELAAHLLKQAAAHAKADEDTREEWADSVLAHHAHSSSDEVDGDLPAGFEAYGSLRELAELQVLDADADSAELLLPELYGDGSDIGSWISPPTDWPAVTKFLGPEAELETEELYGVVDSALDELPRQVADVVDLVDVQGQGLLASALVLGREVPDVQRDLARGRDLVRSRVDAYLQGR
jgi:DNA-directed RNA polymerase specialized sigma24 family protein